MVSNRYHGYMIITLVQRLLRNRKHLLLSSLQHLYNYKSRQGRKKTRKVAVSLHRNTRRSCLQARPRLHATRGVKIEACRSLASSLASRPSLLARSNTTWTLLGASPTAARTACLPACPPIGMLLQLQSRRFKRPRLCASFLFS